MIVYTCLFFFIFQQGFGVLALTSTHEGCFSTSLVKSHRYYEVNFMLTWEECLRYCNHRLTTHAGVQAENSLSTDNHCYCGNNLDVLSPPATLSACSNCLNPLNKQCGGADTMSLYRLRDHTPFSVLMPVHGEGIVQYTHQDEETEDDDTKASDTESGALQQLVNDSDLWFNVDFIYSRDELYYITNDRNLRRSFYNPVLNTYVKPKRVWTNITGFTLDWTSANSVYYGNGNMIYQIIDVDRNISTQVLKFYRDSYLYYFSMDPYDRRILFIEDVGPNLFSYNIDNQTFYLYDNKHYFNEIMRGALDSQNQLLYLVGKYEKGLELMSMDYDGSQQRMLYSGPALTKVKAIDVFREDVVWVNYNSTTAVYTVYHCHLSPRCEEILQIYQSTKSIVAVKIYHPEKQLPGVRQLCSQLGCSHSCEALSLLEVWCLCPPGMTLAKDKTTCKAKHKN